MSDSDVQQALSVLKRHGFTFEDLKAVFPGAFHSRYPLPLPVNSINGEWEVEKLLARHRLEVAEQWHAHDIPYMQLGKYQVRPYPPYGGALARIGINGYSIYLDTMSRLGLVKEPYWEMYPVGDDTMRVPLKDVQQLVEVIDKEA